MAIHQRMAVRLAALAALVLAATVLVSCDRGSDKSAGDQPTTGPAGEGVTVAFVTNNPSDFWQIAHAGVKKAEREFNVYCDFQMPANGTSEEQQRICEALLANGVQGISISPNDPDNQIDFLNRIAARVPLICHDSDAPKSNRLCYVGTNNFKAGQAAGELIKEVLPKGGEIMLFVGRIDAQNAKERADGIKDALKGSNIKVLDIRTDLTDRAKAKSNVEDTIANYPNIGCLVGLWSYNGPAILSAVKDAGKSGKIPIVCFDEEEDTLQGVLDGDIYATVVQQPYEFGYQAVKILAALARKQDAGIPDSKIIEIPVRTIKKDQVRQFWDELKKLKSGG